MTKEYEDKPEWARRFGLLGLIVFLALLSIGTSRVTNGQQTTRQKGIRQRPQNEAVLLTSDQKDADQIAVSLLDDPEILAARNQQLEKWKSMSSYQLDDGKSTLDAALDAGLLYSVRIAANYDPARPTVIWNPSPAYSYEDLSVPDSRFFGDGADRVYRFIPATPDYSYEIRGKRNVRPSRTDFSFETAGSVGGASTSTLWGTAIDISADGTFAITADSAPANRRRNHLTLIPGTNVIYIRDTTADWNAQLPNYLGVKRVDGKPTPNARTRVVIKQQAVALINSLFSANNRFVEGTFRRPVNSFTFQVRSQSDGLPGNGGAISPFSLADDEALVVTIDPSSAQYAGFQTLDPWTRSVQYLDNTSSLSQNQIKANSDGTYTYIISPKDPGYYNWLSTGGLHSGIALLRLESFTRAVDGNNVIRFVKVVKLSDLSSALPAGSVQVTTAERSAQLSQRRSGWQQRLESPLR